MRGRSLCDCSGARLKLSNDRGRRGMQRSYVSSFTGAINAAYVEPWWQRSDEKPEMLLLAYHFGLLIERSCLVLGRATDRLRLLFELVCVSIGLRADGATLIL